MLVFYRLSLLFLGDDAFKIIVLDRLHCFGYA